MSQYITAITNYIHCVILLTKATKILPTPMEPRSFYV